MANRLELAALKGSSLFTDRITMCIVFFAQYIIGEASSVAGHTTRANWAKQAILSPGGIAAQIAPLVAIDPTFTAVQSPITDWTATLAALPETGAGSLQAAVESAINSSILVY